MRAFGATVDAATTHLGPARLRDLADCLAAGEPAEDIFRSFGGDSDLVAAILAAQRDDGVPADTAATYLRGVAAGYAGAVATSRVEGDELGGRHNVQRRVLPRASASTPVTPPSCGVTIGWWWGTNSCR